MATSKKTAVKSSAGKSGRPAKKPAAKKKAPAPAKKVEAPKPRKPVAAASRAPAASRPAPKEAAAAARSRAPEPAPPAKRPRKSGPPRTVAVTAGSPAASKLGTKWNCFRCGAKFYDLNKPEPLCPKCGADQRQRPKVSASSPSQPAAPRRPPRPIAPLLDDEDDGTVRYEEEFDLGVRTEPDETDEELFPPGEIDDEEPFEEEP